MDAGGPGNLRRTITLDSGHVLRPEEVWRKAAVKTEKEEVCTFARTFMKISEVLCVNITYRCFYIRIYNGIYE